MSVIVLNPASEQKKKLEIGTAQLLDNFKGKTIGLLDDGYGGNLPHTFKRLKEVISEKFPDAKFKYWKKPVLSMAAPQSMIEEIASSVDAAIIGACA